jgi:flagellar motor switch protein FliM
MLTQSEIDALLTGAIEIEQSENKEGVNLAQLMGKSDVVVDESSDERVVRPYNFWSPDRFSKDQMRAVELVHEELAERLTNSLPSFLHTNLRPRVVHTEQGRFHDFINDLSPNSLYHMITLSPLPGQIVLTISPEVSNLILEQRLGGQSDKKTISHVLTEIDQSLLHDLVENMLNDIKASWSKVVAVEPKLVDSTVNQHWVQMMVGNERVMTVAFEIMMQQVTGTMSFYIPFSMLKPVIAHLNPHTIITGRKEQFSDPKARIINMENLKRISLPLKIILGNADIRFGEVLNLKVGDVIVLDTYANQEINIKIAGQNRFKGKVGKVRKRMGIKITGKAEADQSFFEKLVEENNNGR